METIIFGQWWRSPQSLACKCLCIFRFCVMSWKGESELNIKYCLGRQVDVVQEFTTVQNFVHNWRTADGIRVESLPGFTTLQLINKVQEFMTKMCDPSQFKGGIIFMSMFNDIIWGSEDNERECIANATLVTLFAKRFPAGRWSFLRPGSEKKWYSTYIDRPRGEWCRVADMMMIKFRESGHSVFRAMSPLSRGTLKSKGGGKLSIHFCADGNTIETVFRTIISVNQLSIYGAVSDVCEEYSTCQTRTGRPVLAGQSDPLFEPAKLLIMTPRPSIEIPAKENLLQKYKERVERLPQQDRLIKELYWCRIPENSWSRTVFHDKGHW